jgi:hypothetical protein
MANLIPSNGSWRARAVEIFKNQKSTHIAPASSKVHGLMEALFNYVASSPDISWLLKSLHLPLRIRIHPPLRRRQRPNGQAMATVIAYKVEPHLRMHIHRRPNQSKSRRILRHSSTMRSSRRLNPIHRVLPRKNPPSPKRLHQYRLPPSNARPSEAGLC